VDSLCHESNRVDPHRVSHPCPKIACLGPGLRACWDFSFRHARHVDEVRQWHKYHGLHYDAHCVLNVNSTCCLLTRELDCLFAGFLFGVTRLFRNLRCYCAYALPAGYFWSEYVGTWHGVTLWHETYTATILRLNVDYLWYE